MINNVTAAENGVATFDKLQVHYHTISKSVPASTVPALHIWQP
jgi:hypothetical protein